MKPNNKKLPFYKDKKGRIGFNPRPGIRIDYGIAFFRDRGHRVFFNYCDTPELKNTWGYESLRKWIKSSEKEFTGEIGKTWVKIIKQQCDLAQDMTRRWELAGYPPEGVPDFEGRLQ